jgi:hypothetical protein
MTGVEAAIAVVWFVFLAFAYATGYQDGKKIGRREELSRRHRAADREFDYGVSR